MQSNILIIHTRTPLHVGSGASLGAIDQPIQRERHTGFPIIPASTLKGSFADHWNEMGEKNRKGKEGKDETYKGLIRSQDGNWLLGKESDTAASAGALLFSEARVILFPIRSAKGCYAWITCPLMLQRAKQDGLITAEIPTEPTDEFASTSEDSVLLINDKLVLEEYCFTKSSTLPSDLATQIISLTANDLLFADLAKRLVILSNGMMSHFVTTCCEVAQHVRINDETGTADGSALFNQENVPTDTLFYSSLHATAGKGDACKDKTPAEALAAFTVTIKDKIHQFGGDATTGHGFCTVTSTACKP
jgi:CRISPR-associated protein Cmr4